MKHHTHMNIHTIQIVIVVVKVDAVKVMSNLSMHKFTQCLSVCLLVCLSNAVFMSPRRLAVSSEVANESS